MRSAQSYTNYRDVEKDSQRKIQYIRHKTLNFIILAQSNTIRIDC